jgi:hypothetical protein
MKKIYYLLLAGLLLASCKKEIGIKSTIAALNVINATVDANPIAVNYASPSLVWSLNTTQIYPYSSMEFGLSQSTGLLNLISSADTTKAFFSGKLNLTTGGIYSLYVAGRVSHYDTLFMKDNIPYYAADSVAGARYINLVTDSQPLSINLVGNGTADFTSLAYKKITGFKKYSGVTAITNNGGGYTYEIRDAGGNLLATYFWVPSVFKNNTLVITGLVGNGTVSVFAVNNY